MDIVKQQILCDLIDGAKIHHSRYELGDRDIRLRQSELAMHLIELKKIELINFVDSRVFVPGGQLTKYRNNFHVMWPEEIIIEPKGREYVESLRTSSAVKKSRKARTAIKGFINDLFKETREQVIKKVAAVLALLIIAIILFIVFWPTP
ncbi:hypothetical protein DMN77_18705 [Paenibacillus sp. 79R4]|uniref:hypothetical protein n=1 Tax=Paenibacillus sp. 79R4 TaxID=2212847 RepID=UPI0015C0FE62|nr:hypothetical protein [Paenibacillus sp. 79R4]NWL89582.1 hypothetical protein [Paenibacillus sp. 79R4]